jgi:cytochrome oxidase Cu insertion factor (SCO1/SenC/PrrC family)
MSGCPSVTSSRIQALAASLAGKPILWLAFIVVMFSWPVVRSIRAERDLSRPPAPLGLVRDFTLRDPSGSELGAPELRGRLWLASFITGTREATDAPAPRVLTRMAEVRHRTRNLGDAFRLLTFTVGPEREAAAQALELSFTQRAAHGSWRFVSGPPAALRQVLRDFHVSESTPQTRVALVDGHMSIRGFYDLVDDAAVALLLRDVSRLLAPQGR